MAASESSATFIIFIDQLPCERFFWIPNWGADHRPGSLLPTIKAIKGLLEVFDRVVANLPPI